jgi:hypothetical protein
MLLVKSYGTCSSYMYRDMSASHGTSKWKWKEVLVNLIYGDRLNPIEWLRGVSVFNIFFIKNEGENY